IAPRIVQMRESDFGTAETGERSRLPQTVSGRVAEPQRLLEQRAGISMLVEQLVDVAQVCTGLGVESPVLERPYDGERSLEVGACVSRLTALQVDEADISERVGFPEWAFQFLRQDERALEPAQGHGIMA